MILNERQTHILKILRENKSVNVKTLAKTLYVSEATVRRDLKEMQALGLLERSHGGAWLPENMDEVSMFVRMEKNAREKERVATKALPHVPSFHSVFIDSSSTALALAERLDLSHKTVVTNSLQTAIQLSKKENINLVLLGGSIRTSTNSTVGSFTNRQLEGFTFDLMICSCSAVKAGYAFERSLEQRELKCLAFEKSAKRILLVDSTKFVAQATYRAAKLTDFDFVVSDSFPENPEGFEGVRIFA